MSDHHWASLFFVLAAFELYCAVSPPETPRWPLAWRPELVITIAALETAFGVFFLVR